MAANRAIVAWILVLLIMVVLACSWVTRSVSSSSASGEEFAVAAEEETERRPAAASRGGRRRRRVVVVLDLDETLVHYDVSNNKVIYRPFAALFLREVRKVADEIVVFTAAVKEYADAIVDRLELMSHVRIRRRFYRDSCTFTPFVVKDLRVLGEPASSEVVMVDNTPSVFAYQPQNGMLVESFTGDAGDRHLLTVVARLNHRLRPR